MKPGNLSSYSDLELALMVMLGYYGNGSARRQALGSRYAAVQAIVDQMISTQRVPDGKGADMDLIQKAVMSTFYDSIADVTKEIMEKLK